MNYDIWHPMRERPPKTGWYIVVAPSQDPKLPLMQLCYYDVGQDEWVGVTAVWQAAITHWTELPDPPSRKRLMEAKDWFQVKHPLERDGRTH